MTAREFLNWALDGDYDLEDALRALGSYIGAKETYFIEFPDADVLDQDGGPLEESPEEPAGFQEYWEAGTKVEELAEPGRPPLPPEKKRKTRSIKMSDAEWEEIRRRAARKDISAAEYLRRKALSKGKERIGMREQTVNPEDFVENLREILGLVCSLEGALVYHCFPDRDTITDGVTEEEKQSWSCLRDSKKAKEMLMDMISELRGY